MFQFFRIFLWHLKFKIMREGNLKVVNMDILILAEIMDILILAENMDLRMQIGMVDQVICHFMLIDMVDQVICHLMMDTEAMVTCR